MTIHDIHLGSRISTENITEIESRVKQKFIKSVRHPTLPYTIYNYTTKTQYDRVWDDYTKTCRGLIIDDNHNVIARPFPKIFNYGEPDEFAKDISNIIEKPKYFNKLDGVLGISYPDGDKIAVSTRGSFTNPQSQFATKWLQNRIPVHEFKPEYTYLFEIIYSDSRIVINYEFEGLVLLAVIAKDGSHEIDHIKEGLRLGIGFARDMLFTVLQDALEFLKISDGRTIEGFVLKYSDGYRIKIKSEDYVKMHKIIFRTSTKDVWLGLKEDRLDKVYEVLPDEMYNWVLDVEMSLISQFNKLMTTSEGIATKALKRHNNKKEIAEYIKQFPEKRIAFLLADGNKAKATEAVWKAIKPKYAKFSDEN